MTTEEFKEQINFALKAIKSNLGNVKVLVKMPKSGTVVLDIKEIGFDSKTIYIEAE